MGGRYTPSDFVADELRNDQLNWLGRQKVNGEVPTARRRPSEQAVPHAAPIRMANGVGSKLVDSIVRKIEAAKAYRKTSKNVIERTERSGGNDASAH